MLLAELVGAHGLRAVARAPEPIRAAPSGDDAGALLPGGRHRDACRDGLFGLAIFAEAVGLGKPRTSWSETGRCERPRTRRSSLYALLKVLQSLVAYALVLRPLRCCVSFRGTAGWFAGASTAESSCSYGARVGVSGALDLRNRSPRARSVSDGSAGRFAQRRRALDLAGRPGRLRPHALALLRARPLRELRAPRGRVLEDAAPARRAVRRVEPAAVRALIFFGFLVALGSGGYPALEPHRDCRRPRRGHRLRPAKRGEQLRLGPDPALRASAQRRGRRPAPEPGSVGRDPAHRDPGQRDPHLGGGRGDRAQWTAGLGRRLPTGRSPTDAGASRWTWASSTARMPSVSSTCSSRWPATIPDRTGRTRNRSALFLGFGNSSLDFRLRTWIDNFHEGFVGPQPALRCDPARPRRSGHQPFRSRSAIFTCARSARTQRRRSDARVNRLADRPTTRADPGRQSLQQGFVAIRQTDGPILARVYFGVDGKAASNNASPNRRRSRTRWASPADRVGLRLRMPSIAVARACCDIWIASSILRRGPKRAYA